MCSNDSSSIDRLAEAIAGVRSDNVALLTAEELKDRVRRLRQLADQVEAVFADATAAFDATEAYKDVGARTAASWLRHSLRMTAGEARRRVVVGHRLKDLPQVREAFRAGEISMAHVEVLAAAVDELGLTAVRVAESSLLDLARLNDPYDLREAVRTIKQSVDADDVDEKERRALERRHFSVTPVGDEYVAKGVLDRRAPCWLRSWTRSPSRSRATSGRPDSGESTPLALCRTVLDGGLPKDNGVRPHLTVVLSWDALVGRIGAQPARLDGFGSISTALVRQLACDAAVARVVLGPDGSPIELGRSRRAPSAAQRRGVRVRDDGCCRVPGCRSRLVQVHHVVHWIDGGPTDLANMISLCPRHHRNVHSGRLRIETTGGIFRFRARDGRQLVDQRPASKAIVQDVTKQLLIPT